MIHSEQNKKDITFSLPLEEKQTESEKQTTTIQDMSVVSHHIRFGSMETDGNSAHNNVEGGPSKTPEADREFLAPTKQRKRKKFP